MHAGIYSDHILDADAPRRDHARRRAAGPIVRGVRTVARRLVHGRPNAMLTDHLLDDIGLSRADLAALTL